MVAAYKFRDKLIGDAPRWLRGTNGYRLLFAIGTQIDAVSDAVFEGVRCRYPGMIDPVHSLPYLCRDRNIRRGVFEVSENCATRLKNHLDVNRKRGLGFLMLEQIKILFAPYTFDAWIIHNRGTAPTPYHKTSGIALRHDPAGIFTHYPIDWHWDDTGDLTRFWVILALPPTLYLPEGYWGSPGDWGDGGYWGVEGDTGQYMISLQSLLQELTPAHAKLESIIIFKASESTLFWADPPDGDWDRWGNRNPIARYC